MRCSVLLCNQIRRIIFVINMARKNQQESQGNRFRNILFYTSLIMIAVATIIGYIGWKAVYASNVNLSGKKSDVILIPSGSSWEAVKKVLYKDNLIINTTSFEKIADYKKYPSHIKPGRYRVKDGMSNNAIINLLRSGNQEPVKLVLFGIRKKEELAGRVSHKLEIDSMHFLAALNDASLLSAYGLNQDNVLTLFIPNTYELFWTSTPKDVFERMASEYKSFWTQERKNRADNAGLSQTEVSVLASIVQSETNRASDKPIIAGVYLNRLHKGMPLEADPTLVWALNDFSIQRVLNQHKRISSPYNTYKNKGLPPGPITLPSVESLDAVLNYKHHNYIYFCAKEDFSGYSNFSSTLKEHMDNAHRYQHELSKRGIMK